MENVANVLKSEAYCCFRYRKDGCHDHVAQVKHTKNELKYPLREQRTEKINYTFFIILIFLNFFCIFCFFL